MRILITGGLGYIGYTLIEQLTGLSIPEVEIVIYDNLSRNEFSLLNAHHLNGAHIRFIKGDLLDNHKLQKEVIKADVVIHLAAMVTTPFEDKFFHHFDQVNHWGTANLVSAVEDSDVKHFIYLSSISVFGNNDQQVDENTLVNPDSSYGISKYQAEKHVQRLVNKIPTHIIRSGNVYGYNPAIRLDAVINRFMYEAQFEGRVRINGDGSQYRGFISVVELSKIITSLVQNPNYNSGTHLAVTKSLSINDVLESLLKIYPDTEFIHSNENMRMKSIKVAVPSAIIKDFNIENINLEKELIDFKQFFIQ
jgi:UDP-glucose 4-epimerase